jgi:hypothetical protein
MTMLAYNLLQGFVIDNAGVFTFTNPTRNWSQAESRQG